ncbi:hypothetical protein OGM63_03185 [Plectonema radiosum NIES-515]|uniref:Uncharacterized protein n=1 Tax=Plectonema radiosum NIES-515 TaxID=2986073 RepID=A0ABT3ATU5_9CYAN|nr:hypothetical protein [Plectonema radiosum]MCV3212546.1 hypothetical protein [Plectonema radiosum NIES-515]
MIQIRVVSFVTFVLTLATTSTSTLALSQSLNKPNTVELQKPIKLVQNTAIFNNFNKYTAVHELIQYDKVWNSLFSANGEELEKLFQYLIPASKQLAEYHNNNAIGMERYISDAQKNNGDVKFLRALREFSLEASEYYQLKNQYLIQYQLYKKSGDTNAIVRLNQTIGQSIKTLDKRVGADFKRLNNYFIANIASPLILNPFLNGIPTYDLGGGAIRCANQTYICK